MLQEKLINLQNQYALLKERLQRELQQETMPIQATNLMLLQQEQALQRYLELVLSELDLIEDYLAQEPEQRSATSFWQNHRKLVAKVINVGALSLRDYYKARAESSTESSPFVWEETIEQLTQECEANTYLTPNTNLSAESLQHLQNMMLQAATNAHAQLNDFVDGRTPLFTKVVDLQESHHKQRVTIANVYENTMTQHANTLAGACELGDLTKVKQHIEQHSLSKKKEWREQQSNQLEDKELPINLASLYAHLPVVRYLLTQGADPDKLDGYGYSAWHKASQQDNIALLNLFYQVKTARQNQQRGFFAKAVPISVDIKGQLQRTPLATAVFNGRYEAAVWLLEHGANPLLVEEDTGNTLLHTAAQQGHTPLLSLLLANKLDVHQINRYGETSLYLAALFYRHEFLTACLDLGFTLKRQEFERLLQLNDPKILLTLQQANQRHLAIEQRLDQRKIAPAATDDTVPSIVAISAVQRLSL